MNVFHMFFGSKALSGRDGYPWSSSGVYSAPWTYGGWGRSGKVSFGTSFSGRKDVNL